MNVTSCRWIYKLKCKADSSHDRYKARLVTKCYKQEDWFDYDATFSLVVKITNVQILISLAISHNWPIKLLDASNVFLHGDLKELIYMDQPPGFLDNRFPQHVCQLQRSLYGLKQAPIEWFFKLTNFFLSLGFSDSKTDPSLFFKYHGNTPYFFLIYVDDILVISPDSTGIQDIVRLLAKAFSMKDLGLAHFFLRIEQLIPQPVVFSLNLIISSQFFAAQK